MSERLFDNGCGEGLASWRVPFRASRIAVPGLSGPGLSADGRGPGTRTAIHQLLLRLLVGISGRVDGPESTGKKRAYAHAKRHPRENCGLNARGLMVAINWCDDEAERFALGASAVN